MAIVFTALGLAACALFVVLVAFALAALKVTFMVRLWGAGLVLL